MSAEDCPFQIIRPEIKEDTTKSDSYIKFEVTIDPNNFDGLKSTIQFKKLNCNDPEDIMTHIQCFDALVSDLNTSEGEARFRLFKLCLAPNVQKTWSAVLDEVGNDRDQANFENSIEIFLCKKVERDCAIDTKEWLSQIKKPRSLTVSKFMERLSEINNLIPYMPLPEEGATEDGCIQYYSKAKLCNI